jgi:hypothetical protein
MRILHADFKTDRKILLISFVNVISGASIIKYFMAVNYEFT